MDILFLLVRYRTLHGEQGGQLYGDEEAVIRVVALVLYALVQLGHTSGVVRSKIYREGEAALQRYLPRLFQLVEELQILKLVRDHIHLCH